MWVRLNIQQSDRDRGRESDREKRDREREREKRDREWERAREEQRAELKARLRWFKSSGREAISVASEYSHTQQASPGQDPPQAVAAEAAEAEVGRRDAACLSTRNDADKLTDR